MAPEICTSLGLFIAMLAGLEAGHWLRSRFVRPDAQDSASTSAADGVVFAMLGLLIAFTFTTSATHFDERRKLINDQANAIGTAWLRVDLLAESDRDSIRRPMREWVKLILDVSPRSSQMDAATLDAHLQHAQQLQNEAWKAAVGAVDRSSIPPVAALVLAPINDWIDLSSTRIEMSNRGLPPLVMPTLLILAVATATLAGFNMEKRPIKIPLHTVLFAGAIAFSIFVILDLNSPRSGFIRVDAADHALQQAYASMSPDMPDPATQPANP